MTNMAHPIRVVVFGSGPTLERGVRLFLCRLEECPDIEFAAVFCQSDGQGLRAIVRDLWRRRRFLAAPMLLALAARAAAQLLSDPRRETELKREVAGLVGRIRFVRDIHSPEVLDEVRRLAPDLGLIYGSPVLKPALFEIPRLGTLGIHHGRLPEYRGKKTTFWAIYNGDESVWVTIQKVNSGLDTGAIVRQGAGPVAHRSLPAVWEELEELGLQLYLEAIRDLGQGAERHLISVIGKGKLYRDPTVKDLLRFWLRRHGASSS